MAVHPAKTIYLQKLNLESVSLIELVHAFEAEDLLHDPFWFQDGEGRCLGIGGFGECGDTLWRVRRREGRMQRREKSKSKKRTRRQSADSGRVGDTVCVWPFFCERDSSILQSKNPNGAFEVREEDGFALELVDVDDYYALGKQISKHRRRRRRFSWLEDDKSHYEAECLVSLPAEGSSLQLGSCSSEEAWMWHINRDGVLLRGLTKGEKRKANRRRWIGSPITAGSRRLHSTEVEDIDILCLHRINATGASLLPCFGGKKHTSSNGSALAGFSLVRYPSAAYRSSFNSSNGEDWTPWITLEGNSSKQTACKQMTDNAASESPPSDHHMPSSRTNSQNHASNAKQRHVEVKSTMNMLHTGLDQSSKKNHILARTSASHIRDAPETTVDGLPFHMQHSSLKEKVQVVHDEKNLGKSNTASLLHKEKRQRNNRLKHLGDKEDGEKGHSEQSSSTHHRPIKIPVHPYIAASKDGVWVDPLTSLEYPTDLCEYSGQTKKEAGRHTLMGVGQYYRTAFNIKVNAHFWVCCLIRLFVPNSHHKDLN
jgi:hypothetical protein